MTKVNNAIVLVALGVALAGCSMGSSMLNRKTNVPQANNVQVGNDLSMPPDLQLPPPGQGADVYQQPIETQPIATQPMKKMAAAPVTPYAAPQDIYDQNGISKVNADGTPKTADNLRIELRAALLKKKQQKNPGYGTIRNIGNIFSDQ
jgi:hypothetical protein